MGFILVIDRRQDRWAAVKGTLLRIAVSLFPVLLLLLSAVRPLRQTRREENVGPARGSSANITTEPPGRSGVFEPT